MKNSMKQNDNFILSGHLLGPMIQYSIPVMLTSILALLYNSADMWVLAQFSNDENAIGAVGTTSPVINLIIGFFMGISAGICVVLAQSIGARDPERTSKTLHTAIASAFIIGIAVSVIGYFLSPWILTLMGVTKEFYEGSKTYIQIYFCGAVFIIVTNFIAGILRSKGDTIHPLIFSSISGLVNVGLNIFFVKIFHMGISGVAIATVISQAICAIASLIYLATLKDDCRFEIKKLAIDKKILKQLIRYGLPAGLQGVCFSFSNILIQSSYFVLGTTYVNANTAASNIDQYIYMVQNSQYHTTLTFASQNYGAGNYKRVKKVFLTGSLITITIGLTLGIIANVFSVPLVSIFAHDPVVIEAAKIRLLWVGLPYFLCGLLEVGVAMLRSIGYSMTSTIINLFGSCVFRIIWISTVFNNNPTPMILYIIYPLSWIVSFGTIAVVFFILFHKIQKKNDFLLTNT